MKTDVFDGLSDNALWEKIEELTRQERRIPFNVVMHLGEVERRRIYLSRGFGSMFDALRAIVRVFPAALLQRSTISDRRVRGRGGCRRARGGVL